MSKVLVDRELLELLRNFTFLHDDGCAGALRGNIDKALAARPAEAEGVELRRLAAEFDAAPDDAEWEPPHPIFQMARDLDRVTAALSAVTAERDAANSRLHEVAVACAAAEQERDQLRAEVEALRKDAERYRWLTEEAWFQQAMDRFDIDDGGLLNRFQSECAQIIDAAIAAKEA